MSLLQTAHGANVWGLNREINWAVKVAASVWGRHGQVLVVTSARDGQHSPGSKHYCGDAVDLRISYFDPTSVTFIAQELRDNLGRDFDVVVHDTHMHVEYDPKGVSYNVQG